MRKRDRAEKERAKESAHACVRVCVRARAHARVRTCMFMYLFAIIRIQSFRKPLAKQSAYVCVRVHTSPRACTLSDLCVHVLFWKSFANISILGFSVTMPSPDCGRTSQVSAHFADLTPSSALYLQKH